MIALFKHDLKEVSLYVHLLESAVTWGQLCVDDRSKVIVIGLTDF